MRKRQFAILILSLIVLTLAISGASAQFYGQLPQEDLYGNETSDLLVWVTDYQPTIVRSDLLEENNVPVYAKIRGVQINPFINIPVITSVSPHPASLNKYVSGMTYIRPRGTINTEDLGWIVVNIRKIQTEQQMPDSIDLNISADIRYDFQDILGFGTKDMTLGIVNDDEWIENEWKYEFWGRAGYLRLGDMTTDQKAEVILYDASKREISKLQLNLDQVSDPRFITVNGKRGFVQLTLKSIETPSTSARVLIDVNGRKFETLLKKDAYLYAGSEWKITSIEQKPGGGGNILIRNSKGNEKMLSLETRSIVVDDNGDKTKSISDRVGNWSVGWITNNAVYFINTTDFDLSFKQLNNLIKSKGIDRAFADAKGRGYVKDFIVVLEGGFVDGVKVKKINSPKYSNILDNPDAKKYFDSALQQFNDIASGLDVEVRDDTKIQAEDKSSWVKSALLEAYNFAGSKGYDQARASESLRKLIAMYPDDARSAEWQRKLDNLINLDYSNAQTYVEDKGISVSVFLEEFVVPELTAKATLSVDGVLNDYKEGSMATVNYTVERITDKDATLRKIGTTSSDVLIKTGDERTIEGTKVKVLSTKVEKEAHITVSPYSRGGVTTANFSIHIGIEKRGIQLSPQQINSLVNSTDDEIKRMEKFSNDMAGTITGMRNTCFATYGVLIISKIFDWSGTTGRARTLVMKGIDGKGGWDKICEEEVAKQRETGKFYRSVQDCFSENSELISKQQEAVKKLLEDKTLLEFTDKDGNINYTNLKSKFPDNKEWGEYVDNLKSYEKDFDLRGATTGELKEDIFLNALNAEKKKGTEKTPDDKTYTTGLFSDTQLDKAYATKLEEIKTNSYFGKSADNWEADIPGVGASYQDIYKDKKLGENEVFKNNYLAWQKTIGEGPGKDVYDKFTQEVDVGGKKELKTYALVSGIPNPVEVKEEGGKFYFEKPEQKTEKIFLDDRQKCRGLAEENQLRQYAAGLNAAEPKGMPAKVPFEKGYIDAIQYKDGRPYELKIHLTQPIDNQCFEFTYSYGKSEGDYPPSYQSTIREAKYCVDLAVSSKLSPGGTFTCKNVKAAVGAQYSPRGEQKYCEDFFSIDSCNILYQVCDPVICPSSRCDFGGRYPVDNVIQSGVIGSILLCAPNFPTPIIAVCLPGIRAGLMSYVSMLKGFKSCLQNQLATGQTVGICDRIRSLYWCDIAWKTVLSMYNMFGGFYGIITGTFDKAKGGGEMLDAPNGLAEAEKSLQYFTSVYADDVFAKFKMLSAENIGGMVCRRAIYGEIPTSLDVFADLSNPEVPPQFFGHVEETAYSNIQQIPTSHYKVYYHIYAGEDKGISYRVYLSNPVSSYGTVAAQYPVPGASGYLEKGGYVDKSPDFVAYSGYRQLCIEIDGVPNCGFGMVSTEMVVQEISDAYAKSLASSSINSESECMFSSPAIVPVIGAAVEGTELLARRGINRICSSGDPNAGNGDRVWEAVGFCDQNKGVKCWLDTSSVKGAIKDLKIQQDTLTDAQKSLSTLLKPGYQTNEQVSAKLNEAYVNYTNKDYNSAIDLSEKILKEASPVETSLLDEAEFIIGLSNERLFEQKKLEIEMKQQLARSGKISGFNVVCPGFEYKGFISDALAAKKISISNWGYYDANVLVQAIIMQESSGNKNIATSGKGAVGLMQVLPSTAMPYTALLNTKIETSKINDPIYEAKLNEDLKKESIDLSDPRTNIQIGTLFFNDMFKEKGNVEDALGYYYAGGSTTADKPTYVKGVEAWYQKCKVYNDIKDALNSQPTTNDKICKIAQAYKGIEIVREEGETSLTCARFVSEVLAYAGHNIKVCDVNDAVTAVEAWAMQHNAQKIDYNDLKCGDLVIVESTRTESGLHIGIFQGFSGEILMSIGEPGKGEPVQVEYFGKARFSRGYRLPNLS